MIPFMSDNTAVYTVMALAAAAAALAARQLLRGAPADSAPAGGRAREKFGPNVRLRDLYRLAVKLEEDGAAFYLRLAEKARDPEAGKLCARLAEAETGHRALFLARLERWRDLPPNRAEWPALLAKARAEGFFADPPADGAAEEEMAAYAIRQERLSADFYRMFEEAFPDAWKKEKLRDLADQELAHESQLRAAYPGVK